MQGILDFGSVFASSVFASSVVAYLFLLAGLVLLIVEMFLPGFGVPGITGVVLLIIGMLIVQPTLEQGVLLVALLLLILGVAFLISLYAMSKGSLSRTPLVNNLSLSAEEGFHSLEEVGVVVGSVGVVVSPLRPVGVVEIEGRRLEASSEAAFIEQGAKVCVTSVEGRRVTVAPYVVPVSL